MVCQPRTLIKLQMVQNTVGSRVVTVVESRHDDYYTDFERLALAAGFQAN